MVVAIIDLGVDRLGHEFTDVFAWAMLHIYCCVCIVALITRLEAHDSAFDILHSKKAAAVWWWISCAFRDARAPLLGAASSMAGLAC